TPVPLRYFYAKLQKKLKINLTAFHMVIIGNCLSYCRKTMVHLLCRCIHSTSGTRCDSALSIRRLSHRLLPLFLLSVVCSWPAASSSRPLAALPPHTSPISSFVYLSSGVYS